MGSGERVLVPSAADRTTVVGERNYQAAIRRTLGVEAAAEDREHVIAVVLVHEPDNPVDVNAIAVRSLAGETLGYLPAPLAAVVRIAEPLTVEATVHSWRGRLVVALHVERRDAEEGDAASPCT